jgi:hypothetical protein
VERVINGPSKIEKSTGADEDSDEIPELEDVYIELEDF